MSLPFDLPESLDINRARLEHLSSLGLDLDNRTVLEPGSGIGLLTGFWENLSCAVTSTELQEHNVNENIRRHPGRQRVFKRPVEYGFSDLGRFEIVFCYGLIYHVRNPEKCLVDMAGVCDEIMLLETMVHPIDDGLNHEYPQITGLDQGHAGPAFRPSRNWIMSKLESLMGFAYISRTQPMYPDFVLSWPGTRDVCRSVFVGSKTQLNNPNLLSILPMVQTND